MSVDLDEFVDGIAGRIERLFDECMDPNDVVCESLNALPRALPDKDYFLVCQLVMRRMVKIGCWGDGCG